MVKDKAKDEMFKYKMGHKGLKQFTLDEINKMALLKWRQRARR